MRGLAAHAFRSPFVAIAVVVLVTVSATGGALEFARTLQSATPPAEAVETTPHGVRGGVTLRGGVGNTGTEFVTSWAKDGMSQVVTVQGRLCTSGVNAKAVEQYRFRVYVDGVERDGLTYTADLAAARARPPSCDNYDQLSAHTFSFTGSLDGTHVLKVEQWVLLRTNEFTGRTEWHRAGVDGALLHDGSGRIALAEGQSDIFQEGDTIRLAVSTSQGQWRVKVYNGLGQQTCGRFYGGFGTLAATPGDSSGGTCLASVILPQNRQSVITFVVPQGAFRTDGQNVWKFVLENTLIEQSAEKAVVIDRKVLQPEPPSVSVSDSTPSVGDTVKASFVARRNGASGEDIRNFRVYAWYGTAQPATYPHENWIAHGHDVTVARTSDGRFTGTYEFRVDRAAKVQMHVHSVDVGGRVSASTLNTADAQALEDEGGIEDPNTDSRVTFDTQGAEDDVGMNEPSARANAGLIALLIVLAIVGGVLVWGMVPAPPQARVAIIVVGGGILVWVALRASGVGA